MKKSIIAFVVLIGLAFAGYKFYKMPKFVQGEVAQTFDYQNIDGSQKNLKDLRGKYVLLDFWGSWCGPCRVENPKLVALYSKFQGKDFEILSVGIERNEARWKNAIEKDGLNWSNHTIDETSSFKFLNGAITSLYGVSEVPTKYLISPDGMIIGVNQSVEEIDALLSDKLL